jgi:hypothetical protein
LQLKNQLHANKFARPALTVQAGISFFNPAANRVDRGKMIANPSTNLEHVFNVVLNNVKMIFEIILLFSNHLVN